MCTGNYPLGAEYDKDAPWNEKEDLVTVEVDVCVCVSKLVKIRIEKDELKEHSDLCCDSIHDAVEKIVTEELRNNDWTIDNLEIFEA